MASSREGGSGDKQGSKVVSPAATAVTFDRAATATAHCPPTHPNCPLQPHTLTCLMTEVCQRIDPVISFCPTVQEYMGDAESDVEFDVKSDFKSKIGDWSERIKSVITISSKNQLSLPMPTICGGLFICTVTLPVLREEPEDGILMQAVFIYVVYLVL